MKLEISLITVFVIFISCFASAEEQIPSKDNNNIKQKSISSTEFVGFEKCRISNELSSTLTKIIAEEIPIKKDENAWTYSVSSEVMGLPVKAIQIGVCSADGARDCGWGSYLALTIAKPFNEARRQLKRQKGIDYSQEERDKEYEVTLRPVLAISKADGETVLFCDPGTL